MKRMNNATHLGVRIVLKPRPWERSGLFYAPTTDRDLRAGRALVSGACDNEKPMDGVASAKTAEIVNEMKEYAFFKGFPLDLLSKFASMASTVTYAPGDFLLEQGSSNEQLFFLRKGEVAILVDGEAVSTLATPGEVLGEMSLINNRPVAASVKALTEVDVYRVDERSLQTLPPESRITIQSLFYRIYAGVLATRLERTNQKAKRFEIAHRELQKAHEDLARVNAELEDEIARRSRELVEKVRSLTETHLQPARATLTRLSEILRVNEILSLSQSIGEVVDFLKPVADFGDMSNALASKRVLVFDANRKQLSIARLALGGTGVSLSIASSMDELDEKLSAEDYDLIIADAEVEGAVAKIANSKSSTPLALMMNLDMRFYLNTLRAFPGQKFFISRDVNNRAFTVKGISTTVMKILNRDFLGIEKYLAWGAKIIERPVSDSEKRKELISEMSEHFQSIGIRSNMLDRAASVSEELLMNAIYDAPVDRNGLALFNHLPRTERVVLNQDQMGKFRYGTDGVMLGVSVSDPFGALTKDVIIRYLDGCYQGQSGSRSPEKGGAGRGLHMMIEMSDLTIFNVKSGRRTEVICLFSLETNKDEESHPTFHLFFS